ncbi:XrtA/PEP-CTERM system TPR-repeat protein PrsT [Aliiglaciecola sp. LCG003]|uniref:XrtA/PEP-CTERM system TPR-repeat protein PrsT n=1 Tax=Aliiglaciecola sp. LCG003 TaxID=3053655 RepID=UPI002573534E|nr:XrtA/PEP-CTERM system TPR-repeat protein PrsT [Aliiglaciecola sp. LCG003]WJG08465.1 PEP-CTERM system TPR-repeat protein PrsT [Aliiglaciecola sp. LCG003]
MNSIKKYGLLLATLALVACSQKTPTEYIEEAESAILENQSDKAIIVLKNALSSDPKNLKARFLLGSIYFSRGNAASAEKELKIAFDGGYFKNQVLPIYLGALDFLKKDQQIITIVERVTGLSAEAEAAAQTYKGLALFRQNEVSRAKLAIKRAAELAPQSSYSRLGRANHALQDGELNDALMILQELLTADPEFMQARLLQGQLSLRQKDYETAIQDFKAYNKQMPGDAQGNFLLIDALLQHQQYDEAEALITPLVEKLPDNPRLNEFVGVMKFNKNDYAGAKVAMEQAIANGSNAPRVRLIAGVAAYQQNKLEQAHSHLASIQNLLPTDHPGKRLFAEIQLRLGYSTDAAQTLSNLGGFDLSDARLFTQAGFDLVNKGNRQQAKKMLELAKKVEPSSSQEKTRLGMLKLSLNDRTGYQDLEEAIAEDPEAMQARLALAQSYVVQKNFDSAAEVAKQWISEQPDNITAFNLLAEIYTVSGQLELAKLTHKRALDVAPNNPTSLKFLAKEAEEQGNNKDALVLLERAAKENPEYLQASFEYLVAAQAQGSSQTKDALSLIKAIHEKDPNDLEKKLNYARALVLQSKPQQVLDVLTTVKAQPDLPVFYWKAQADSLLALNNPSDALNVYLKWQQLEPMRREPWLAAIVIYDGIRDLVGALDTVKRAQNFHQNDAEFKVMEVHYSLINGNVSVAQRLLNNLPAHVKSSNMVKGLQGQIYYAEKKFSKALPLLQAYYDESGDGRFVLYMAEVKKQLNEPQGATDLLEKHLQVRKLDLNTRARLAEMYMQEFPEKAIEHYVFLVEYLPENIIVLNNLGWLYGQTGETVKAVDYAEKAVALRPENPMMLDTLGVALLKNGDLKRALEVSKKAFDLQPSNQDYRIHYEAAQKANQ